jgi:hypothetical protein
MTGAGVSPGLAALIRKRPALAKAVGRTNGRADAAHFAKKDGKHHPDIPRLAQLRRVEARAAQAYDVNLSRIAGLPALSIEDVLAKFQVYLEESGMVPMEGQRFFKVPERGRDDMILLSAISALHRLYLGVRPMEPASKRRR